MSWAQKLIAASAVVVLCNGSLLAGPVVSQSTGGDAPPEATTGIDLIPGVELVVEEVEPGTYRVLSDGIREFSQPAPGLGERDDLLTGLDGSVWLRRYGRMVELGKREPLSLPANPMDFSVSRDGTPWVVGDGTLLYASDDGEWQVRFDGQDVANRIRVKLTTDDAVWVLLGTDEPGRYRLRHFDGREWVKLPGPPAPGDLPEARMEAWAVGDDGTAWAIRRGLVSCFDGERWEAKGPSMRDASVAPLVQPRALEGDALILQREIEPLLQAFPVKGDPERLTIPDVPGWGTGVAWGDDAIWALAPDGAVWRSLTERVWWPFGPSYLTDCAGLARFDGESWTRYLPGRCVVEIDFGPDGSVWTYASSTTPGEIVTVDAWAGEATGEVELETLVAGPAELYAITPEAIEG